MQRRNTKPRAKRRQEMLQELAADETVCASFGNGYSRATEAVDALRKIQDGTYGICAGCNKRIPAARLQIKPEATRCVACQSEYEERNAPSTGDWNNVSRRSA